MVPLVVKRVVQLGVNSSKQRHLSQMGKRTDGDVTNTSWTEIEKAIRKEAKWADASENICQKFHDDRKKFRAELDDFDKKFRRGAYVFTFFASAATTFAALKLPQFTE